MNNIKHRNIIVITIFSGIILGPPVTFGSVDIYAFDMLMVLISLLLLYKIVSDTVIQIPKLPMVLLSSSLYISLSILLPLLGFIIYQYPVSYIVGDVRWIQSIILIVLIIHIYDNFNKLFSDIYRIVIYILSVSFVFVAFQILSSVGAIDFSGFMSFWHQDQPTDRPLGYGQNQFAGPATRLGLFGRILSFSFLITFSMFVLTRKKKSIFWLSISTFLLFASGVRTSMVSSAFGVLLISTYMIHYREIHRLRIIKVLIFGSAGLAMVYLMNIGGIRTSDRYGDMVDLLLGRQSWGEATGRDLRRWLSPIEYVESEYLFGTLANPSHVLNNFRTFDSYYVIAYLQGGVFLLTAYFLLLMTMLRYSICTKSQKINTLLLSIFAVMFTSPITQNLQGLFQKLMIVLTIGVILVYAIEMSQQECKLSSS